MNKKLIIILIIILVIILIGGLFIAGRGNGGTEEPGGLFSLFPFGRGEDSTETTSGPVNTDNGSDAGTAAGVTVSGLRKITTEPISGADFVTVSTTSATIRFVDKATGHIFEINSQGQTPKRISNTTIPQLEKIYWSERGDELIGRFVKDRVVNTIHMKLTAATTTTFDSENLLGI